MDIKDKSTYYSIKKDNNQVCGLTNEIRFKKRSKHIRLSPDERLQLFKEFICSANRRQLAKEWNINPSTLYDIVKECETNVISYFRECRPDPKGKNLPTTFGAALERIKDLEERCKRFEIEFQRFNKRAYLGDAYQDKRFPISQKEYYSRQWMMDILQGKIGISELKDDFKGKLDIIDIRTLLNCIVTEPLKKSNRAIVILSFIKNIPKQAISKFLHLARSRVGEYIDRFEAGGVKLLLKKTRKEVKKFQDQEYKDRVFAILHSPPSCHGINSTSWKFADISRIMRDSGFAISRQCISKIIKDSGYQLRKAKTVLTSTDPNYREKLEKITHILSNLKPNEKFFSIDEFGPFSIRMVGGRSFVPRGKPKTVPQWQKSKGKLIVTAALELSTNQVTHFYSEKKNTKEMIKLLTLLLKKNKTEECIYFSWDAAKWHASKKLYKKVDEVNEYNYRKENHTPLVKLAPLPACAQFLNVIESIFSGMAKAIIHNSDYQSVQECKHAIDRYFYERNENFIKNPKRAGKKIWGEELIEAKFSESNNCKNSHWR